MMTWWVHAGRGGLLAGLAVTVACGQPDTTCNTPAEGLTVRYVGQAYGYGTIDVAWNDEAQHHRVSAQMMGPDSSAKIRLQGEGTCREGTLRARLAGGRDEQSGLQVLGGGLVVLFDHHPMPSVTGWWDVRVVDEGAEGDGPDGRRIRGMLEAVDPDDIPRGPRRDDEHAEPLTPGAEDASR